MASEEVVVIINQDAGRVASKLKTLRKLARHHNLKLKLCEGTDLDYTLRQAIENKHLKRLIIGGGDGSVSLAASLVRRFNPAVEVAILPVGTGNFYAKSLGINKNLKKAFETSLGDSVENRHLCQANKRDFLLGVNVGVTSRMFAEVTNVEKERFGRIAYFRGVFRILLKSTPPDVKIEAEGKTYKFASTELVVLNQNLESSLHLLPDVKGTQPYFEIITYGLGKSKLSPLFAVSMFALTFGHNQKYLKRIRTTSAKISTSKKQPVAIDGDSLEKTPLQIEMHKKPILFVRSSKK